MCLPNPPKLLSPLGIAEKWVKPNTTLGHIVAPITRPMDKQSYKYNAYDDYRKHITPEAEKPQTVPGGGLYVTDAGVKRQVNPLTIASRGVGLNV